jgi:hypothetical protein
MTHGLEMITCIWPPPADIVAPPIAAAAEPGSIGAPVKLAVPDRMEARYRGSR